VLNIKRIQNKFLNTGVNNKGKGLGILLPTGVNIVGGELKVW
jgi:hypothetical protein